MEDGILDIFASDVFTDTVAKKMLKAQDYNELQSVINGGKEISKELADACAAALKDWAISKGATHYTHWFHPLNDIGAEKHESFLEMKDGKPILEFSGKQLIKGESDASSFPSGGIRAIFEARGYSMWDVTSPAFIKTSSAGLKVLNIPTAFCSFTGETLDKKTPLLKAMQALNREGLRLIKHLGNKSAKRVILNVGAEQEYFLIDKAFYKKRKDLILTGRTLFGAPPAKGQEKDGQYYGNLKARVSGYMKELNEELWRLGISAKTQHNEVAPCQHELAPIYTTVNIATDQNQLIMEVMKKLARKHNFACLLHEKPFRYVNGSGKHNNVSICLDDGTNLLAPGEKPHENKQFLLILACIIAGVNEYAPLIRMSASYPGNDHRLGASEAPPAIISVFIGDKLYNIFESMYDDGRKLSSKDEYLNTGVSSLPVFLKDTNDRNRTSPFAFTVNKFEFRMIGSSATLATPNIVICAVLAEMFKRVSDRLDKVKDKAKLSTELDKIIGELFNGNKRIIFNGNNYSEEWKKEAERRGLPIIGNCIDSYEYLKTKQVIDLYTGHGILTEKEIESRYEIYYENYISTISTESLTMLEIARKEILPAVIEYCKNLGEAHNRVKQALGEAKVEHELLKKTDGLLNGFYKALAELDEAAEAAQKEKNIVAKARKYRDGVINKMDNLRTFADALEKTVDEKLWPFPTYTDIFFK